MTITASDATKIAADYYESIAQERVRLSVEEIEHDNAEGVWLITLGIAEALGSFGGSRAKEYKTFKINIDTGDVLSMKIRKV